MYHSRKAAKIGTRYPKKIQKKSKKVKHAIFSYLALNTQAELAHVDHIHKNGTASKFMLPFLTLKTIQCVFHTNLLENRPK